MKIFVPDITNYKCYIVQSEGVLRGYEEVPKRDTDVNYRDFYIKSNYIYKDGIQSFGPYSTLPICLQNDVLTTDLYYRNDLDSILIIFLIFSIFAIYLPIKLILRLFKRFR